METKKLSVIVPIYNMEAYLQRCLDSALLPGRSDYEIIAVDDGSTDGSGALLADYARRYPTLVYPVTRTNGGLGAARNTALPLARGEYVLFLDSDDRLAPGALAEMLQELEDSREDVLIFDLAGESEAGRLLDTVRGCGREGSFSLAEYPALLHDPPSACNKLWRRYLFTETGLRFPGRLWFEDLATTPTLYLRARHIRYVPRPWYRYLRRDGSITRSANAERNLEIITAVDATLDSFRQAGAFERYRQELCYMALFHQLITATVRVALIDAKSPVLERLVSDFLAKFPDWAENPYVRGQAAKYRLLTGLILRRRWRTVCALMRLKRPGG